MLSTSFDLFSADQAYLPVDGWLPDETFYSMCSRLHRVLGHPLASMTTRILFGHSRRAIQHDIPTRVSQFVENTRGAFGLSDSELVLNRSVLPLYLAWIPYPWHRLALDATNGFSIRRVQSHIGLKKSRNHQCHALKFCRECIRADREAHGMSYWHLQHQYPAVWICLQHRHILDAVNFPIHDIWLLPSDFDCSKSHTLAPELSICTQRLSAYATLCLNAASFGAESSFEPGPLALTYRNALESRGLITPSGQTLPRCADQFMIFLKGFEAITEVTSLHGSRSAVARRLSAMISTPFFKHHPVRHILLIDWLFGDWQTFVEAHLSFRRSTETCDLRQWSVPSSIPNGTRRSTELFDSSTSVAGNIAPETCSARCKSHFQTALEQEFAHGDIAPKSDASINCVCDLMRSGGNPARQSRTERNKLRKSTARKAWLTASTSTNVCAAHELRDVIPSEYQWLAKWDRRWLRKQECILDSGTQADQDPLPNQELDRAIAQKILEVVRVLRDERPNRLITRLAIVRRIPNLKANFQFLATMPRTLKTLRRIDYVHDLRIIK